MAKRAQVSKAKNKKEEQVLPTRSSPSRRSPRLDAMEDMAELHKQAIESERMRGSFMENMDAAIMIDKHSLDECVMQQPELFHKVAERLALDISLRDEIKDRLSVIQAEADAQIRRDAEIAEMKVSETQIKMEITKHPDVVEVRNLLASLNKSVGLLQALKESYGQRSYMLKELVSLYLAQYYGDETATASGAKDRAHERNKRAMREERERRAKNER